MARTLIVFVLLALAGCAAVPQRQHAASACAGSEASYQCQVQRYHDVSVD